MWSWKQFCYFYFFKPYCNDDDKDDDDDDDDNDENIWINHYRDNLSISSCFEYYLSPTFCRKHAPSTNRENAGQTGRQIVHVENLLRM